MKRQRRQHEARDIAAAIDRAVDAERFVGVDDGDMRRAEEIEVFKRLFRIARFVTSGNAQRVVKLKAALAAAIEIDTAIFARERKVAGIRLAAGRGAMDRSAKCLGGRTRGECELPGLAVAPRRGFLRSRQYALDGQARLRAGPERAGGIARCQQIFEKLDRRGVDFAVHHVIASVGAVPRTQRSAISVFTRVFDALWRCAAEPGSILSLLVVVGPGSAEQRCTLHRVRDTRVFIVLWSGSC